MCSNTDEHSKFNWLKSVGRSREKVMDDNTLLKRNVKTNAHVAEEILLSEKPDYCRRCGQYEHMLPKERGKNCGK